MNPKNFIDTALDHIISDIWPIINEYCRTQPIFAVGKIQEKYSNYRLITEDDLRNKIIINLLVEYYKNNKGISSLDDFYGDYVCGDDLDIGINGRCLQYSHLNNPVCLGAPVLIKKFNITSFCTSACSCGQIAEFLNTINVMSYQVSQFNTGLFVINNIIPDKKNDEK